MTWIAIKMLIGDHSKYFALIFGITFSCFLIAEQNAIFCRVVQSTTSMIRDTQDGDFWIINSELRYFDDTKAISDDDVFRERSLPGVAWAVNLYRGSGHAQLATGKHQQVVLMGVNHNSLTGAPFDLIAGMRGEQQNPDAILVDEAGYR